ncbi:hypothetical protein CAPTEDRAFT_185276 [Capitella teleta]|uniref:Uncharacterized protein n=1 Tax=Capitella teleta TaxID=283909 RepID=R7T556_CAPTE|nr:hypothetical protein CAPTEDRAFT_185276 [Capitella teleta]|eukprot:ELT88332.1 hypothetical protein CAPTEDRAFT_185276 [Capitella teleta]
MKPAAMPYAVRLLASAALAVAVYIGIILSGDYLIKPEHTVTKGSVRVHPTLEAEVVRTAMVPDLVKSALVPANISRETLLTRTLKRKKLRKRRIIRLEEKLSSNLTQTFTIPKSTLAIKERFPMVPLCIDVNNRTVPIDSINTTDLQPAKKNVHDATLDKLEDVDVAASKSDSLPSFIKPGECTRARRESRSGLPVCTTELFRQYYERMGRFPECGEWVGTEGYGFAQKYELDFCRLQPYNWPECSMKKNFKHFLMMGDSTGWRLFMAMINSTIAMGDECTLARSEGSFSMSPSIEYFSMNRSSLRAAMVIQNRRLHLQLRLTDIFWSTHHPL